MPPTPTQTLPEQISCGGTKIVFVAGPRGRQRVPQLHRLDHVEHPQGERFLGVVVPPAATAIEFGVIVESAMREGAPFARDGIERRRSRNRRHDWPMACLL